MIAFQKNIWAPTTEASKEMVVNAESSARTNALIERFRQTGDKQHKENLASVCYMATFGESQNAKGVKDFWRKQETAHLNGLVVTDFDHVEENLLTLHARWQTMLDFKKEGILKVFVTPSGKGIKVVSKWRKEWGNLAQNQLQMARMLDMERYLDTCCKDASRAAFVPMLGDVLYEDDEVYTFFNPECDEVWGEVYRNESPLPASPCRGGAFSTPASHRRGAQCLLWPATGRGNKACHFLPTDGSLAALDCRQQSANCHRHGIRTGLRQELATKARRSGRTRGKCRQKETPATHTKRTGADTPTGWHRHPNAQTQKR